MPGTRGVKSRMCMSPGSSVRQRRCVEIFWHASVAGGRSIRQEKGTGLNSEVEAIPSIPSWLHPHGQHFGSLFVISSRTANRTICYPEFH